ncbi:BREX-2 system adenine-specific DNA-methyltransferase PglX [Melissospora conviva]|uniref:BREX-2 system adenine-specific DNA-methyltransferase PglX n=1 Tax=Melissospora conviva TaxID=3388432 RepID=UPI003B7E1260
MIDSSALLADLKAQLRALQADLKERADDPITKWGADLRREHAEALRHERTGLSWSAWRDNEVDQAAVAWIVTTTFVRFCEDNDLLVGATLDGLPVPVGWIAGPGDRTLRARENQTAYFRVNTSHHDRDWLQQSFRVLAAQLAGKGLVDPEHNPVWTAEISAEAAKGLVDFWRRTDAGGALVHDFTDPDLDTRFLGDLYQYASEHARKTYALLQTPVFVEEFILDRTLTPAIQEFGLDELRLIDPTCGSGHFLLGAFERLNQQWAAEAPGLDPKQRVRKAMQAIHGVDLNPFAIAIARFRLTVAAIAAAGERSLVGVPELGFHLAIGDSLLGEQGAAETLFGDNPYTYATEDLGEYFAILKPGRYHVVVGNPPYITVKDKVLSQTYRRAYTTAHRKYALSVPFMELFYRLAIKGARGQSAGYVGQITSNSFMKREFGKKLIEELFAGHHLDNPVDLTQIIDSSGAWMPGHNFDGTPTVIVFGRRRKPVKQQVHVVLGVKDDAGKLDDPATGPVWTEISEHVDDAVYDGKYISVSDIDRSVLSRHPWSLSGGGASQLMEIIKSAGVQTPSAMAYRIGFFGIQGADDAFMVPSFIPRRLDAVESFKPLVFGDQVRDFRILAAEPTFFPYSPEHDLLPLDAQSAVAVRLWPLRSELGQRATFSKHTYFEEGRPWYEWHQLPKDQGAHAWTITFSEVATHNHFVLVRERFAFKQTAPIIKLPESSSERDHQALAALLNSSTVCFWLKQVCQKKGGDADTKWLRTYQFNSTKVGQLPLPAVLPNARGARVDDLVQKLAELSPHAVVTSWIKSSSDGELSTRLAKARREWDRLIGQLIFEQEELDWEVYYAYGILDQQLTYTGRDLCEIPLGARAFEIMLAREPTTADREMEWFQRHGSVAAEAIPVVWPEAYRQLVEERLNVLKSDGNIGLLERPEYKRRWEFARWDRELNDALRSAILDLLEDPMLWRDHQGPTTRSVAALADVLRRDETLMELSRVLTRSPEPDLVAVLGSVLPDQAVPFLAADRYTDAGLEKFAEWQSIWRLQRREDSGESVVVPIPPKYDSTGDFRLAKFYRLRGKLDTPKERFIVYPRVGREGDGSEVLGWAGWSHRDQAVALVREILNQQTFGASKEALVPLVAGLVELEPWLHQWHTDLEPEFGSSAAQAVTSQIDQFLAQLQMTRDDVNAWRPPAAARGRRRHT